MTDIVKRLKYHQENWSGHLALTNPDGPEAAAEIERLRADNEQARTTAGYWKAEHNAANAEIERLKKVLHEIAEYPKLYGIHDIDDAYSLAQMAERALEKKDAS